MIQPDYSKIINKTAKKVFRPYDIKQKGKSRIWLDDKGWYTTVIEFQPFTGREGSTLNVGINFNWHEQVYFSFDIGSGQDVDFIEYDGNEDRFSKEIEKLCDLALNKVLEYRENLQNIQKAKPFILSQIYTSEDIWGNYHKGTICGLTNDLVERNEYYQKLLQADHPGEWLNELKDHVNLLIADSGHQDKFSGKIIEIISKTRALKKLPEMEINFTDC
ncbi:hypothetical protein SAMN05421594_3264 [Chryseobacterium oleae]|uniref:DUF4304 domain-containing protein n=1 Tax=Chryseobacterium oleae TaxID=491207 RepID=A0A1I5A1Y6_CHROL|nr:hypothetical protein [Chryseobacterium oleae]SFN56512.1 hypothetical protein SAMN05421594_3264 [Chryseobacterium oleae]